MHVLLSLLLWSTSSTNWPLNFEKTATKYNLTKFGNASLSSIIECDIKGATCTRFNGHYNYTSSVDRVTTFFYENKQYYQTLNTQHMILGTYTFVDGQFITYFVHKFIASQGSILSIDDINAGLIHFILDGSVFSLVFEGLHAYNLEINQQQNLIHLVDCSIYSATDLLTNYGQNFPCTPPISHQYSADNIYQCNIVNSNYTDNSFLWHMKSIEPFYAKIFVNCQQNKAIAIKPNGAGASIFYSQNNVQNVSFGSNVGGFFVSSEDGAFLWDSTHLEHVYISLAPTNSPTVSPTSHPTTSNPSPAPTKHPSKLPSKQPTYRPTTPNPSPAPTKRPSPSPSPSPTAESSTIVPSSSSTVADLITQTSQFTSGVTTSLEVLPNTTLVPTSSLAPRSKKKIKYAQNKYFYGWGVASVATLAVVSLGIIFLP